MDVVALSLSSPREHLDAWCRLDRSFWERELKGLEPSSDAETFSELESGPDRRSVALLALDDGEVVGGYNGGESLLDNTDVAYGWIVVDPAHTRRGVATTLLAAASDLHSRSGRKRIESSVRVGSTGSALSARAGATVTQIELCNVLDLARLPADLATATSPPAGYHLRTWTGRCPDDLVEAYAAAHGAMNDVPRGTAQREDWSWTAERVRDAEERQRRSGITPVTTAAVSDRGEVAGYTDIVCTGRPTTVIQEDTGVVRAHRGHGLGLLVKVANLEQVRSMLAEVRTVVTWNAESNQHMLAVNDRLGFRPHSRWEQVELEL